MHNCSKDMLEDNFFSLTDFYCSFMAFIVAIDDLLSQVYCVRAYRLTIAYIFHWLVLLFLLTQIFISYILLMLWICHRVDKHAILSLISYDLTTKLTDVIPSDVVQTSCSIRDGIDSLLCWAVLACCKIVCLRSEMVSDRVILQTV